MGQALLKLSPSQERVVVCRAKPADSRDNTPMGGDAEMTKKKKQWGGNSPTSEPGSAAAEIDPILLMQHEVGSATTDMPSHDLTNAGHYVLIFFFYGTLVLYLVALVLSYLNQPAVELNSIAPTGTIEPLPVSITVSCLGGTSCGNMQLTTNYTYLAGDPVRQAACAGGSSAPVVRTQTLSDGQTVEINLCYFTDPVYSSTTIGSIQIPGIVVSMDGLTMGGYGGLDIRSKAANGEAYHKFLTVAPGMVKSFNMGLSKRVEDGSVVKLLPYSKNYQMEGLRLDMMSDVVLQLAPYANLQEINNERSLVVLLADVGSMFELLKLVFLILGPLWALIFAKKAFDKGTRTSSGPPV